MIISAKYEFGDEVYLKTDEEQIKRLIVRVQASDTEVIYQLVHGIHASWHLEFEFTKEYNLEIKLK